MTLNPFCIAGGESGTLTTHLYLQLSMAFREARIHKLIYMHVGASMERNTEQWWERQRHVEEKEGRTRKKRDIEGGTDKPIALNTSGYFCPELFLKRQEGRLSQLMLFFPPVNLF